MSRRTTGLDVVQADLALARQKTGKEPVRIRDLVTAHPRLSEITDVDELMQQLAIEMNQSLAQIIADLVPEEQDLIMSGLDDEFLLYDWSFWGRPSQQPPDTDDWHIYAYVGGRGVGKTRSGAEWIHKMAIDNPGCRIALVSRTAQATRDDMVEGESGLITVGHPDERPRYQSSTARVLWPNGSQGKMFSAEEPGQLRGPQFHYAWADEAAAWKHNNDDSGLSTWDNLEIATRLGEYPQLFVTTTPKRTKFMFDLLDREKTGEVIVARGSTAENAGNLNPNYIRKIYALHAGTRLEAQELHGVMLDAVEGALWDDDLINDARIFVPPGATAPKPPLMVIAVDPTVAEEPEDECGIIVAGATNHRRLTDREAWVIEDMSIMGAPQVWAKQVVKAWEKYQCPVIVETNQGGALVKDAIHAINANIPILEVKAKQGKRLRAEPVTLKYDQGRVHHVDYLPELESQMVSWVPEETRKSPDRVDALVYALTALLIKPPGRLGARKLTARSLAGRRLPEERMQSRAGGRGGKLGV